MVDIVFRQLSSNVGHYHCFELNKKEYTFENLMKLRIFLKSRVKVVP